MVILGSQSYLCTVHKMNCIGDRKHTGSADVNINGRSNALQSFGPANWHHKVQISPAGNCTYTAVRIRALKYFYIIISN
jgi:hypothetical protein